MDYEQLHAALPATATPLWVPPIRPYLAFRTGDNLYISRLVDGFETLDTVYNWESTVSEE
jgi:hypothetical protein